MEKFLPEIPVKRYFTIGEVSDLCGVKPHVLRYWEQEFTQLRPMKRRGNRRYYQHHEVLMIRRIRELLYDQGFTISGARNKLQDMVAAKTESPASVQTDLRKDYVQEAGVGTETPLIKRTGLTPGARSLHQVRRELFEIRDLLTAH